MVKRDTENLHQAIRFFIDKLNVAIDDEESINNVIDYCGDRKMSAHQVEYWSNK